ncbi:MAG: tRNA 2-thiouridine(34) synthase MnmA [Deltaproteobacteria bacterium]|nr:tRNA 2-thiouridine(34) synthase MnmA [Deltaproteobacteria bacterium]
MKVLSKNLVVVAMSGGVDSSVAAYLLKEQRFEVIGISMKTHESTEAGETRGQTCCAARDIRDARRVCQQLDIPFYPINFKAEFEKEVIQNFLSEYTQGRTPNPCVRCNQDLKFSALLQKAHQLGAYYLATGHYVQKVTDEKGHHHLLKAKDIGKDQSYFLFGLTQESLGHTLFPLGGLTKAEVRQIAKRAGLETSEKPESQEICFVSSGSYGDFVESRLGEAARSRGLFVTGGGMVLGEHAGIHRYTVGQRRGTGIATGEKVYVTEIRPEKHEVVLGPKESLLKKGVLVKGLQWVHPEPVSNGMNVLTKIRYRHLETPSLLTMIGNGLVRVDFENPDGAVTPGQAAVFYKGDELIGGGWIERAID